MGVVVRCWECGGEGGGKRLWKGLRGTRLRSVSKIFFLVFNMF